MAELPPRPERIQPPRLPGTYTAGHERDASPRVGRVVLVALGLVCLGVQGLSLRYLPPGELGQFLFALGRVGISWVCIIALAAGLSFTRWPLAFINAGIGLWLVVQGIMGSFRWFIPGNPGGGSVLAFTLGAGFVGAGLWFGFSADLSAYLDRQRVGALSIGSRMATVAGLAVVFGLSAVVLTSEVGAWLQNNAFVSRAPHDEEGARFALDLVQRAVQAKDFSIVTAAMSSEAKSHAEPDLAERVSADLRRRGTPLGFRFSDVVFSRSPEEKRELTSCSVYAIYATNDELGFFYALSCDRGAANWRVDTIVVR